MVDRIRTLIQARELSTTQFADAIGVARPVVSHILSGRNKASLEVFQKILAAFPELSTDWLLNGTGAMLTVPPVAIEPPVALAAPVRPIAANTNAAPAATPPVAPTPAVQAALPLGTAYAAAQTVVPTAPVVANVAHLPQPATPASPEGTPAAHQPQRGTLDASATKDVGPVPNELMETSNQPENQLPLRTAPASLSGATASAPAPSNGSAATAAGELVAGLGAGKAIRRIVIFYRDGSFADYQPE